MYVCDRRCCDIVDPQALVSDNGQYFRSKPDLSRAGCSIESGEQALASYEGNISRGDSDPSCAGRD